jgi:hypothetical protein
LDRFRQTYSSPNRRDEATLLAWAKQLGLSEAEGLLQDTLVEEENTDEVLSKLAEDVINPPLPLRRAVRRGRPSGQPSTRLAEQSKSRADGSEWAGRIKVALRWVESARVSSGDLP